MFGNYMLEEMSNLRDFKTKRISSYDKNGGNYDWVHIKPHETKVIASIEGPGCIKRFYVIPFSYDPYAFRNTIIRVFWDDSENPSVEVPLGDFFGIGNCIPSIFSSLLVCVSPGSPRMGSYGVHTYFPMPFNKSAKFEIENQSDIPFECFWYHIDYELYNEELPDSTGYFHAFWNRETTVAKGEAKEHKLQYLWQGKNTTADENYIILDTNGNGHISGLMLYVDNLTGGWWGEGDDMIFIDGEKWPPSIHGTGTEEIFGGGGCPTDVYNTPYCGYQYVANPDENWYRQSSMYRFYVNDPIRFKKSIKMTIEHGTANNMENDYSSVVFWYQKGINSNLPRLRGASQRIPCEVPSEKAAREAEIMCIREIYEKLNGTMQGVPQGINHRFRWPFEAKRMSIYKAMREGKYDLARSEWEQFHNNKVKNM